MSSIVNLHEYQDLLVELKAKVRQAQLQANLAVNKELILLYWQIGQFILQQQNRSVWGSKIIDNLAKDLKQEFPEMKGFSTRNLKYMRTFAESYDDFEFVQAAPAQITWYHNTTLLDKVKDFHEKKFYMEETLKNGWSRNILVHQIESNLYKRQIQSTKTHNFHETLPATESELAHEMLKDPYKFDFLGIGKEVQEKDLENALVEHITKFLLELGAGFAFVGRQYHLEVANKDFYLDLLFYHTKIHAYVVLELKVDDFKPEYAGKLNFYLSAIDEQLKTNSDNPSIGIILCRGKNKLIAEYALKDMTKPIGVSEYQLTESIPENLRGSLPSIEDLENELANYQKDKKK